jgi:hypothetical protein
MKEIHLIIIWSKALEKKQEIIEDINKKFNILKIYNVTWSLNKFSENLSRFYGENLPKNSGKEKHCGNDTFTCIIVSDETPVYDLRKTSKGFKTVNTRLFDVKQLYRGWTGGGHKIHATDDITETKNQLALLFGEEYQNYMSITDFDLLEYDYENDLKGSNGWNSFEELFYILNLTSKYVILRNFENLNEQLNSLHPDVDLLVENKNLVANIINAYPTTNKSYRVQYSTTVSGKKINFDLRYVGDNYYCYSWEREILKTRASYRYFYTPNSEIFLYSLIYHALVHKENISSDYIKEFNKLSQELNLNFSMDKFIDINLLNILLEYMDKRSYLIVEPTDISVLFNNKLILKKMHIDISKRRKIYYYYLKQRLNFKFLILKIKNKIFNNA